jgi:hypothetical protein
LGTEIRNAVLVLLGILGFFVFAGPILFLTFMLPLFVVGFVTAGGLVSVVWLILVGVAVCLTLSSNATKGWLKVARQSALALAIGLSPHALFLMALNFSGVPDWGRQISGYERAVAWLNDTLGHYLLPSFIAGTSISILMFAVTTWLDNRTVRTTWQWVQESMRFLGLVLETASFVTLMTAAPVGKWQPNAYAQLKVRVAEAVEAEAKLAISQQLLTLSQNSDADFPRAVRSALSKLGSISGPEEFGAVQDIVKAVRDEAHLPLSASSSDEASFSSQMSRQEARQKSQTVKALVSEDERLAHEIGEEIARTIGSGIGSVAESFLEKLVSSLIDDAAASLAGEVIRRTNSGQQLSELLARVTTGPAALELQSRITHMLASMKHVLGDASLIGSVRTDVSNRAKIRVENEVKARIEVKPRGR